MSYPVMPTIPMSLSKGVKKTPNFGTIFQPTAAGMNNAAAQIKAYPTTDYEFDMSGVEGDWTIANTVIAGFIGTYIACGGRANLFLFTDPNDNSCTAMPFGTGDGVTTKFQLMRSVGGVGQDVIQNWNGAVSIYNNGVLQTAGSAYSVDNTGVVTFVSPPVAGHTLTVTGSYYKLCRFADDTLGGLTLIAFNTAGQEYWDVESIKFSTEFVTPGTAGATVQGVIYENFSGGTF